MGVEGLVPRFEPSVAQSENDNDQQTGLKSHVVFSKHVSKARGHSNAQSRFSGVVRPPRASSKKNTSEPKFSPKDAAAPFETKFGKDVDQLASYSPTLQKQLKELKDWTIGYADLPQGVNGLTLHDQKIIVISSLLKNDAQRVVNQLSHEVRHALNHKAHGSVTKVAEDYLAELKARNEREAASEPKTLDNTRLVDLMEIASKNDFTLFASEKIYLFEHYKDEAASIVNEGLVADEIYTHSGMDINIPAERKMAYNLYLQNAGSIDVVINYLSSNGMFRNWDVFYLNLAEQELKKRSDNK